MKITSFSAKQQSVLNWWVPKSPHNDKQAIICDGAVRSGKTMALSFSFVIWAFANYNQSTFALCGRSVKSVNRNLVVPLCDWLHAIGFTTKLSISNNLLTVNYKNRSNYFYLFGGNSGASSSIIQGVTLAGALFDEVALMPQDFVEQALARCSIEGSKFWFSCNPEHPSHWFYRDWIKKTQEKNAHYIHFEMIDNPSLSKNMLKRYSQLYSGVFYERFVLGRWTSSYGAVYPMFNLEKHTSNYLPRDLDRFVVSCDYGTSNPTTFGLWGYSKKRRCWHRMKEYFHCSRSTGTVKTDSQYYADLLTFIGGIPIECVVIDPSAASFIQCINSSGKLQVTPADNNVNSGIQKVSTMLLDGTISINISCENSIREFQLYRWDLNSKADKPLQQNDHCMDDIRYFVNYVNSKTNSDYFYAAAQKR